MNNNNITMAEQPQEISPVEEPKIEPTLIDKITSDAEPVNENKETNNVTETKTEVVQDKEEDKVETPKQISRNNNQTLSHNNSDNNEKKDNSLEEIDPISKTVNKDFYTSKETLTASSKKKPFGTYSKAGTYRLNKNSSDFQVSNREERIEESLKRMNEYQKKHDEYMKRLKEKYEEKEKEKYKPFSARKRKDEKQGEKHADFLERMKQNQEVLRKKQEKMKEEQEKKLQLEKEKKKEKEKKISKEMVNKKINEIYEWDAKRKQKIQMKEEERKRKEEKELENCFKPKINNSSKKMARRHINRSTDNAFERLYKEDVMKRKAKNEILKTIYTPLFKPMVNKKEASVEQKDTTSINDYEDYTTNVDIENMLRVRVNKKRNKKNDSDL